MTILPKVLKNFSGQRVGTIVSFLEIDTNVIQTLWCYDLIKTKSGKVVHESTKGEQMITQKAVPIIEVSDEILTIQIYQTLDEVLAETSDLNILKSCAKLIGEANQKALALLAPLKAETKA